MPWVCPACSSNNEDCEAVCTVCDTARSAIACEPLSQEDRLQEAETEFFKGMAVESSPANEDDIQFSKGRAASDVSFSKKHDHKISAFEEDSSFESFTKKTESDDGVFRKR